MSEVPSRGKPPKSSDYPRDLAIRVLTRVLSDHEELDAALSAVLDATPGASPNARGWLQEVCAGTLRWKGRLDLVLDSVALKKKPSGWLRKALLVAAYQLVVQERTAAGRVVSETVDEVRSREGEAPARFANACLRKVSEHAASWRNLPFKGPGSKEKVEAAAAWASLPPWLWRKLVAEHGPEWAQAYAQASFERPTLWVRSKGDANPAWPAEAGPVPGSWRDEAEGNAGAIPQRPGFAGGEFFVQDISSQLLVHEISQKVRGALGAGRLRALDPCAAPGGKSAGLSWEGFEVTASDRDERRLALLRQTAARVAPELRILEPQAWEGSGETYDLIWVDAPCTGSGILRRHPEVRWLRREDDLPKLAKLQRQLLLKAWAAVRPGGFLAYSVCSVLREEGPQALAEALPAVRPEAIWELHPQTAPHGDGFWAALVRKPV